MEQNIKLIVTDLDGTFLEADRTISQEAVCLVDKLKHSGIGFTFITGRPFISVKQFADRAGISLPVVTCNGAEIVQNGDILLHRSMPLRPLQKTILSAMEIGATVLFYSSGIEYAFAETPWVKTRLERGASYPQPEINESFWISQTAEKVTIMNDSNAPAFSSIIPATELADRYTVCSYGNSGCEITDSGINKGTGLKTLSNMLGIPLKNIMAVGDSENDIEMFKNAGIAVAVANATDNAKQEANYICDNTRTNGVIEAIHRFCLQDEIFDNAELNLPKTKSNLF